jgi:hypothetical protein
MTFYIQRKINFIRFEIPLRGKFVYEMINYYNHDSLSMWKAFPKGTSIPITPDCHAFHWVTAVIHYMGSKNKNARRVMLIVLRGWKHGSYPPPRLVSRFKIRVVDWSWWPAHVAKRCYLSYQILLPCTCLLSEVWFICSVDPCDFRCINVKHVSQGKTSDWFIKIQLNGRRHGLPSQRKQELLMSPATIN